MCHHLRGHSRAVVAGVNDDSWRPLLRVEVIENVAAVTGAENPANHPHGHRLLADVLQECLAVRSNVNELEAPIFGQQLLQRRLDQRILVRQPDAYGLIPVRGHMVRHGC